MSIVHLPTPRALIESPRLEISSTLPQNIDIENLSTLISSQIAGDYESVVPLTRSEPWICIDRGCGLGTNSLALHQAFSRAVHQVSSLPILSVCNERDPSGFGQIAKQLQATACGLVHSNAFQSMVCGSFLDQLLPTASVDLVTSNAALHWLDLNHPSVGLSIVGGKLSDDSLKVLAEAQWSRLLSSVCAELRRGGKLIVSFIARPPGGRHIPLQLLELGIRTVLGSELGQDFHSSSAVPIYLRNLEEIQAPFVRSGVTKLPLRLERCEIQPIECPYFAQFLLSRNSQDYAINLIRFIRDFSQRSIYDWLLRRGSSNSAKEIVELIFAEIRELIAANPLRWRTMRNRAVVVATRI